MKKSGWIFSIVCLFASCNKSIQADGTGNGNLIGKWQLSETLADPGDGTGTYQPVDPSHPSFIEFKADGTLISTPASDAYTDYYEIINDSTLSFGRDTEKYSSRFIVTKTLLTLHPRCYEPCGQRFVPVQ